MKRIRLAAVLLPLCLMFSGCQPDISKQNIDKTVEDIKAEAVKQIKKSIKKEIEEFFSADDLASTLGISSQELKGIESSIRNYVDNYEFDEEALEEIKASVEGILSNAEGLSAQELESKIKEIFEN